MEVLQICLSCIVKKLGCQLSDGKGSLINIPYVFAALFLHKERG